MGATWEMDIYDLSGASVLSTAPFYSAAVRWVLNAPGAVDADFSRDRVTFNDLKPGEREVKITRDGTVVWGGYAMARGRSYRGQERTRFEADGYFSHFRARPITNSLSYSADPQQDIVSALISYAMAQTDGNLGFTFGTHTGSSVSRDRTYCRTAGITVADAIEEFTRLDDGLDFEIAAATKALNTWSPQRKNDLTGSVIFQGSNVMDVNWREDARDTVSYVHAVNDERCGSTLYTVSDATAASTFKRRSHVLFSDRAAAADYEAEADEYLRSNKLARMRARITYYEDDGPTFGSFWLGDLVRVVTDDFDKTMRVMEIAASIQPATSGSLVYFEVTTDGATT